MTFCTNAKATCGEGAERGPPCTSVSLSACRDKHAHSRVPSDPNTHTDRPPDPQPLGEDEAVSPHQLSSQALCCDRGQTGPRAGSRGRSREQGQSFWHLGAGCTVCTHVSLKGPQPRRPFRGSWEGREEGPRPAQGGPEASGAAQPTDSAWAESGSMGGASGVRGRSPGCTPHPTPPLLGH